LVGQTSAGIVGLIVGYGGCQTACNAAWVACLATAGVVAGTVTAGAGAPAAVLASSRRLYGQLCRRISVGPYTLVSLVST
ncbi:unnamed protein product, partial [Oppiella nova]